MTQLKNNKELFNSYNFESGDLFYNDSDNYNLNNIFIKNIITKDKILSYNTQISYTIQNISDTVDPNTVEPDIVEPDLTISESDSSDPIISDSEKSETDHLYCNKCLMKNKVNIELSNIEIFNIVNEIIFTSSTMPDIYMKMERLNIKENKWFELNNEGLSIFHWLIWYISIKIKKYNYLKSRVYAFFQKVFSDNTVRTIFSSNMINKILTIGTPYNPDHTILYHLVRYCENPNDKFYIRMYNLLLERGAKQLTDKQLIDIKLLNSEEENIPISLKDNISIITDKYKIEESNIINDIETKYLDYKINKCIECEKIIDYTKEIPNIISYAKLNNCDMLLNSIWSAYYQRKLLNTIFDKYYNKINAKSNLNMIHKRHSHILEIYQKNLDY